MILDMEGLSLIKLNLKGNESTAIFFSWYDKF